MKNFVIIVAGGLGKRMKSDLPKQFLKIGNKPVLMHTISVFKRFDNQIVIILALQEKYFEYWKNLCKEYNFNINHLLVEGGKERFYSVKNALQIVNSAGLVAIHDGVRPLVSENTIKNCFKTARQKGNAIPVIPVNETIRQKINNESKIVDRSKFIIVQTPQVFNSEIILRAYNQSYNPEFTDDASVIEAYGEKINLVEGNQENIKITTQADIKIAEFILQSTNN